MTDPGTFQPTPPSTGDRVESIGRSIAKYAAIITTVISVAVPATEYARGFTNQKIKETEQRTTLAIAYLDRIAAKDSNSSDRIMYLGALARLDEHPLQQWAKDQLAVEQKQLDERKKRSEEADAALKSANDATIKIVKLQGDLDFNQLEITQADNKDALDKLMKRRAELNDQLQKARTEVTEQIGKASSAVTAATAALTDSSKQIDQTLAKIQDVTKLVSATSQAVTTAAAAQDDLDKLTPEVVKACWPSASMDNVSANLPLIKGALKELGLTDKPMLIAAMGVVRINSTNFAPFVETQNRFNTSDGGAPFDLYDKRLGNSESGDGAKYRGRGFLGLTGKANYQSFGAQLGGDIDLVKNPDLANRPDVAARLLAAYLKRYADPLRAAIGAEDYPRALRLVTGGSGDLPIFVPMAKCVAQKL